MASPRRGLRRLGLKEPAAKFRLGGSCTRRRLPFQPACFKVNTAKTRPSPNISLSNKLASPLCLSFVFVPPFPSFKGIRDCSNSEIASSVHDSPRAFASGSESICPFTRYGTRLRPYFLFEKRESGSNVFLIYSRRNFFVFNLFSFLF